MLPTTSRLALLVPFATTALLLGACSSTPQSTDGDGGPSDGGSAPATACRDVPTQGRCLSASVVERCIVTSEKGDERIVQTTCATGEACQLDDAKEASCVLVSACREGASRCAAGGVERCAAGSWAQAESCSDGCVATPEGPRCAAAATPRALVGTVVFGKRFLASDRRRLEAPVDRPARGFHVAYMRGAQVLATTTSSVVDGSFALPAPATAAVDDRIEVAAATLADGALELAIIDPKLPPGLASTTTEPSQTAVWAWTFPVTAGDGQGVLRIPAADHGSGAANLFDRMAEGQRETKKRLGRAGDALAVLFGPGVTWDCGACQSELGAVLFGTRFRQAIWYPADDAEEYFADPVIFHELGHWVMASYGRSPGEGGAHAFTCPSFPGLAWSEGFASWFAAFMLADPLYFDNQGGLFWYDHGSRTSSSGGWSPRPTPTATDVVPTPTAGLLQPVAEIEVTAMLWTLSNGAADADVVLRALASDRMRKVGEGDGFERRYTRHEWALAPGSCSPVDVIASAEPSLSFADALDAMACAGLDPARIAAATEPASHYPFVATQKLCR